VQAERGQVGAERERGQVRVGHPDDAQQAQQAEAVRRRGRVVRRRAGRAAGRRARAAARLARRPVRRAARHRAGLRRARPPSTSGMLRGSGRG